MSIRYLELRWWRVILACTALAAVIGCSDAGEREGGRPSGGGVVIGLLSDPKTLNPLVATSVESQNIINLMFLRLLEEQRDFVSFKPNLAERWEFGQDSLSVVFHLRKDAVWQDGVPVTADDVRYTWELQTDTLVAWASRNLKDRIRDVQVVDAQTVVFHFTARYPYQLMDANDGVILPKHVLDTVPREEFRVSDFGRHPIGNGPFKLARWVSDQYIELERNSLCHEGRRSNLERVVFRVVPDMTTLVTQLKAGEIDCLESIPADAVSDIEAHYPDVRIYTFLSRHHTFISWNLDDPLLERRAVRRALAMAVDTEEMIETLWGGMAGRNDSPMHPILWAHDSTMTPIPFDPEAAQNILVQEGWVDEDGDGILEKDGVRFEIEMITNQGNQLRADVIAMTQEYLRRVGVRVVPRTLEWNTFIQRVVGGEYQSCVLGWKSGTRADLTNFWRSTSTPPGGFNIARYENVRVDSLIDKAKNTLDTNTARSLWYSCQRIIYDDQPFLFIAVPYEVVGLQRRFHNVEPNVISFFVNLHEWYVDDAGP